MKDRIKQFMQSKGMTQKALASELCISESTLTGIFLGRTRPTVNIIDAFHQFFPEVNMYWLMYGEGEMYSDSTTSTDIDHKVSEDVDSTATNSENHSTYSAVSGQSSTSIGKMDAPYQGDLFSPVSKVVPAGAIQVQQMMQPQIIEKYIDKPQRKITEIRIFFDDGTYETFTP